MTNTNKATLIGLLAIVCWSTIVGLIRSVSEILGATGGAAMIYSAASILLFFTVGIPKINTIPRAYLLWGSLLFVSYELCLALSIGYAFWNAGILHGNITILAGASYFTPILSSALAAIILQSSLSSSFWQGASMVCAGSILCWLATRVRKVR
jgi:drug/metabolite transporter (DMT)-like permease